jgi:AcrR family transcriptional regulator
MSRRPTRRANETRERLMDAAVATLRDEGVTGTSARSIAARAGANQALVFYHFGSVANLLLESFRRTSDEQVARYRQAAESVGSLTDLVEIARRLHDEDAASGVITSVTQLMAAATEPTDRRAIMERFDEWIGLVQDALERAFASGPLAAIVPTREAAYAISAMFLGIELMSRLDPDRSETADLFEVMANLAQLAEQVGPVLAPLLAQPPA